MPPLWLILTLTWLWTTMTLVLGLAVFSFQHPDRSRAAFPYMLVAVIALTPLPIIATFISGDVTPGVCGAVLGGYYIYLLHKHGGGRWRKKVKKAIGAKSRALRAKLTASMPGRAVPVGA